MKVTVFVPIEMNIEGIDRESEVRRVLTAMEQIVNQSELEANPVIQIDLVGDTEIVVNYENTPERAILSKAGMFLSFSDDDELLAMVKAIINHEDENEMIDYIDDVCVWEKVEFSFTVGDFCEQVGYTGKEFKN